MRIADLVARVRRLLGPGPTARLVRIRAIAAEIVETRSFAALALLGPVSKLDVLLEVRRQLQGEYDFLGTGSDPATDDEFVAQLREQIDAAAAADPQRRGAYL